MKTFAVYTLGCKVNQLESSRIIDDFLLSGWEQVDFRDMADIYIINSCTVTGKSDNTTRYFIRQAKKTNPNAKIIVTGCYAQVSAKELSAMPEVDMVLGNLEKNDIYKLITASSQNNKEIVSDIMEQSDFINNKVISAAGRTRVNIKIQDGCNYRCSYCIIPYARGKSRSNKIENILEQINLLVKKGYQEIIFTGIHLGQWGLDFEPKQTIVDLIKEIEKIEDLKRYRLSSLDPREITDEFIDAVSSSNKFCKHLHISLQSANDKILKAMRRPYTVQYCKDLLEKLKEKIPYLAIGSDVIVGFPGESDEDFENTYENLKEMPVDYLHVFPFSKRKGTPADSMPGQVIDYKKKQRADKLRTLATAKKLEFIKTLLNKEVEVVAEFGRDKETKLLKGMTDNYVQVLFKGDDELKGKVVKVKITKISEKYTSGEVLQ